MPKKRKQPTFAHLFFSGVGTDDPDPPHYLHALLNAIASTEIMDAHIEYSEAHPEEATITLNVKNSQALIAICNEEEVDLT